MELGFSSDLGVTNSRYPEEICEGQLQMQDGSMMGLTYDQLDISAEEMEDVDLYMQGLCTGPVVSVNDPTVKRGGGDVLPSQMATCAIPSRCIPNPVVPLCC